MTAAKKQWVFIAVIQSPRFTDDYKFGISVSTYK